MPREDGSKYLNELTEDDLDYPVLDRNAHPDWSTEQRIEAVIKIHAYNLLRLDCSVGTLWTDCLKVRAGEEPSEPMSAHKKWTLIAEAEWIRLEELRSAEQVYGLAMFDA